MIMSFRRSNLIYCQPFGSQRRLVTSAVAAAGAARSSRPRHVQDLSMLLLVNKNFERHFKRGLLDQSQLIDACQIVEQADYALLVVGSQTSSSSAAQQETPLWPVLFANTAAVSAFTTGTASQQQVSSSANGSSSGSSSCGASSSASALQDTQELQHVQLPAEVLRLLRQQQQQQPLAENSSSTAAKCSSCGSAVLQDVVWQHSHAAVQQQQLNQALTIKQLLCCHVHAPNDAYLGVAVLFDTWQHADGCLGAAGWPHVDPAVLLTQQQLQNAAEAVRVQADAVRQLKQGQGLSNKDPAVVAAVAALQQLKQQLAHLQGLHEAFSTERQRALQRLLQLDEQQNAQQQQQQQSQ